jgi:hypothetical protein
VTRYWTVKEILLASERYQQVTGKTNDDFIDWLQANESIKRISWSSTDKVHTGIPEIARKLDMLLSPHWYALLKMHLAQQEAS